MRRLARIAGGLVLPVLLLAQPAFAAQRTGSETQATTRASAPTSDAPTSTEYVNLDGLKGFRVCASADSGQTLSGAGSLLAWVYNEALGRWARNPDLDLTVGASRASMRDTCFPDQTVVSSVGRVFYSTSGVTVSSGSVTVTVIGWY